MKLSKLLLAVAGATMLLGVLVGPASARNLSVSSTRFRNRWVTVNFSGGFGTVECEVLIEGSFHSRTYPKSLGTLIGYTTAARVIRCPRGGGTIDIPALPWHDRYGGFQGTLPNISGEIATISGVSLRLREPTFGVTCQITGASLTRSYTRGAGGAITNASVSGTASCSSITSTISGTTTDVDNGSGTRITLTLI